MIAPPASIHCRRVVLIDPHTSTRELLTSKLTLQEGYEVVGSSSGGSEGLTMCERLAPNVVVLELVLPGICGTELLRRLQANRPPVRTLVYSGADKELQIRALHMRPQGFVQKTDPLTTLLDAIRIVCAGGMYYSASLTDACNCVDDHNGCQGLNLTRREREILQLVAESYRSKEIAGALNLSVKTIENHRLNIMRKLGVHDTAALTRYAVRQGFVR